MAHKLPLYYPLIKTKREPIKDDDFWDRAEELFDNKNYKSSIIETLNYANKDILKGANLKKNIDISKIHGAIEVNIKIDEKSFSISTKIAKVDKDSAATPLLRRVAEINFSALDFAQIRFKDNLLYIDYVEPIELCSPRKVNYVLQEILFNADEFYNEFIELYDAKEAVKVTKEILNTSQQSRVIRDIREYLGEVDSYIEYYEKNDKSNYAWDIIIITLYRISNMSYLNGYIKYEIMQKISMLHNRDIDFQDRISRGKIYINELKELSDDYYKSKLYFREDMVTMLKTSDIDIIKDWVSEYSDTLKDMEESNDNFAASYYAYAMFLRLIYNYNISRRQRGEIETLLEKISRKDLNSAKDKLITLHNQFINKKIEDKDRFIFSYSNIFWISISVVILLKFIVSIF